DPQDRHQQGVEGPGGGRDLHRQGHGRRELAAVRLAAARAEGPAPHAARLRRRPLRGRPGGHRHRGNPVGRERRGGAGGGRLGRPALGDQHRKGGRQGLGPDPRGGAGERGLQVADRRRRRHRRRVQVGPGRGEEAHHQPAAGGRREGGGGGGGGG